MTPQFIRLSNVIINTLNIIKIKTYPNAYHIYMTNTNKITGTFWQSLGVGELTSSEDFIEIKINKDNKKDFEIISKWIKQIDISNRHLKE